MITTLIILILFMLLTREVWCWYFKFNHMVGLLKEIQTTLRVANEMTRKKANGEL